MYQYDQINFIWIDEQVNFDGTEIEISSANFKLVSEDGVKYDYFMSISGLEPKLTTMYSGNTQEGLWFSTK